MLSLEQIKSVTFDRIVRGYRPEDVDDFIAQVAEQLEKLMNDNKELENKLYILADSVEGYRNDEEALKAALINAQRLGESVIREANQKAEHILKEAKVKADRDFDIAMEKVHAEQMHLARMQQEVARFRGDVIEAYKQHIHQLSNLPIDDKDDVIPVNYFDKADKEFSDRQYADRQAAQPISTVPEAHQFEPPVVDPLMSGANTPPQSSTQSIPLPLQQAQSVAPTPAPAPVVTMAQEDTIEPPAELNFFENSSEPDFAEQMTPEPQPAQTSSFFNPSDSDNFLTTEGFEQAFVPRENTPALSEEQIRMAQAKRNAANATSEFSPIIPLMSMEEEKPAETTSEPEPAQPAPSGRVSLFDHYSEFKLD